MTDLDDAIFVDVSARPKFVAVGFLGAVFVATFFGVFVIIKKYFFGTSPLGLAAIAVIALLVDVVVTMTIAQLVMAADVSKRRAVFVAGTEVGVRKGSDGFLIDLSEPHSGVLKLTGDVLTLQMEGGGIAIRVVIDGFDEPEMLRKFEEAGMVTSEPSCCRRQGVSVHLRWDEGEVAKFLHRLLDLLWEYRELGKTA